MKLEEVLAPRLAAGINAESAELDILAQELANAPQRDDIHSLRARGSILQ